MKQLNTQTLCSEVSLPETRKLVLQSYKKVEARAGEANEIWENRRKLRTRPLASAADGDAMEFKWEEAGEIVHVAPLILHDALVSAIFTTGDKELDSLLQMARQQFRMPDAVIRKESLEKLWDAWEQLKTIEDPNDKRNSVAVLLDRASTEPQFRQLLEEEAKALTRAFW